MELERRAKKELLSEAGSRRKPLPVHVFHFIDSCVLV
jgi:hypothetical protein